MKEREPLLYRGLLCVIYFWCFYKFWMQTCEWMQTWSFLPQAFQLAKECLVENISFKTEQSSRTDIHLVWLWQQCLGHRGKLNTTMEMAMFTVSCGSFHFPAKQASTNETATKLFISLLQSTRVIQFVFVSANLCYR